MSHGEGSPHQFPPAPPLSLRFGWPVAPRYPYREAVCFGAWHPTRPLRFDCGPPPPGIESVAITGRNWALIGSADCHGAALAHAGDPAKGQPDAVAFRGYILEPALHCWAGSEPVLAYWSGEHASHNGAFATILIDRDGVRLRLIAGAFALTPLFYRRLPDGLVLFASSPRYLTMPGDELDPIASRMLFHRLSLCGDASLVPGVRRVAPGQILEFGPGGMKSTTWFDFGALPRGEEPIDERAVAEMEEVFQVAMDRCLRLMHGDAIHLPLSSGDDSRRILAALVDRKVDFRALTVRIRQKQYRDLDARFAREMARYFGFRHQILEECESLDGYRVDEHDCRLMFASEDAGHTWLVPLVKEVGHGRSVVFDGIGGDIFGNTGFGIARLHTIAEPEKLAAIAEESIPSTGSSILQQEAWAPLEEARESLERFMQFLPEGRNRADLAFIFVRSCRSTTLWHHHLLSTGCVAAFPYFDLDHAAITMKYDPLEKLQRTVQSRCLEQFWPEYYNFPGSRRIPKEIPPGTPDRMNQLRLVRLAQLWSECGSTLDADWLGRIKPRYRALAIASRFSGKLSLRLYWWLTPLLMLESHRRRMRGCWEVRSDSYVQNI